MSIKSIHFLAFPQFGEQDLLAAWELLRSLAWSLSRQGESLEVTLGTFEGDEITTPYGPPRSQRTQSHPG
jgi:hypothetical protein